MFNTVLSKHRTEGGFTLLELMVVALLVGILTVSGFSFWVNGVNEGRKAQVKAEVFTVRMEIDQALAYGESDTFRADGLLIQFVVDGDSWIDLEAQKTSECTYVLCGSHESMAGWYYIYDSGADTISEASQCPINITPVA